MNGWNCSQSVSRSVNREPLIAVSQSNKHHAKTEANQSAHGMRMQ